MRGILIVVTGFAVVAIAGESTLSGQGSSNSASLTVNANVVKNCTITTAPVNFGAYDPVAANSTAPLDGIGTVTVACTRGAVAKIGLNPGGNPTGAIRRMTSGGTEYLTYELYKDTARQTIWGDTTDTGFEVPAAPSIVPRTYTVYGRVVQAQDAAVGTYTDTVLATVNF